jgi:2-aminoethylphosphonate transport system ATP-binding protein
LAQGNGQLISQPAPAGIGYDGVAVAYKGTAALRDFSLTVRPGEILALIGPSGCGKTTVLRATAGFVRPAAGRVSIGGRDVTDLPPYERNIGMVVQNYALFPHMRVTENVAFGLNARHAAPTLTRERVQECLRMVGMASFAAARYPRELSGGQQQRVAIARALAIEPEVLLLDEPLSALDAQIRLSMLEELARLHAELPNLTVIYVTHDQTEALTIADRIGIMRNGVLTALGRSQELYRTPPNRFAAEFLGRANLVPVEVQAADATPGMAQVQFAGAKLLVSQGTVSPDHHCLLCIRPHALRWDNGRANANVLSGTVLTVQWKGDQHEITLDIAGRTLRATGAPMRTPPEQGEMLELSFAPEDGTLIPDND